MPEEIKQALMIRVAQPLVAIPITVNAYTISFAVGFHFEVRSAWLLKRNPYAT
jgi:hypothetical protein